MAARKQYGDASTYEAKLSRVMARMEAESYNYNFDRHGAWVEFRLKGQLYRFDHTREKAAERGFQLTYGSDCFAQIVLSLEDLARMAERGIYEIQTWLAGMKFLPPPEVLPDCLKQMGFVEIPVDVTEVKARFRTLAQKAHPDTGGSEEQFITLQNTAREAIAYMEARERGEGIC